ncbi:Chloride channel protein CLC-e [Platanthera zijinensis]|uniref:Chloride channel protein n=1 Tax=Platanthera zijinensis TaxID=2320716 RepID=A0AAP0GFL2_9ASPA
MHAPRTSRLQAVERILRYLKTVLGQGLVYKTSSSTPRLVVYSDADYAGSLDDRRSTSGFCTYFGGHLITWRSKKQAVVARSSAEAEYRSMASVVSELTWLESLLVDLGVKLPSSALLLCDSQAAIHIAKNPVFHERTKHIEVDCHFIWEKVQMKKIELKHVPGTEQVANILTKALPNTLFYQFLPKLDYLEHRQCFSSSTTSKYGLAKLVTISSCILVTKTMKKAILGLLAVHEIRDFFWDGIPSRGASWLREEPLEEVWLRVILVPACGGVIVGILNSLRSHLENPSMRNGTSNIRGALSSFVKAVAASVTLGTGNSLGPEGPSVEIGSSIAKGVGHLFKWNAGKSLSIVAAGSAAGISSGFNAAVSGCFFAVESVLWPSPSDAFSSLTNSTSMVILSSVIASIISEVGLGSDPTFTVPEYDFRSPSDIHNLRLFMRFKNTFSELPLYLLLGILCGLVSLALSRCTSFALKVADNLQNAVGIQRPLFPALGGLTVGLIALAYPEVLYWGFQNVDILLESRPFVKSLSADILFQLVGVKIIATAISRASGLVGGYYAPSLFIGAATGMAYGKFVGSTLSGPTALFHLPILDVASPQAYGLVGMAATLAGVCQVPLTSVLLLFELTQDYRIVLPLLGAVGISSWITSSQNQKRDAGDESDKVEDGNSELENSSNNFKEYDYSKITSELPQSSDLCELESSLCVYDHSTTMNDFTERLIVSQAMRTRYITVQMSTTVRETIKLMILEKQYCALITDSSNLLLGLISLEEIQEYGRTPQAYVGKTEADGIQVSDVLQTEENKTRVWTASPNMPLSAARRIMDSHVLDQLPVVSHMVDGQISGPLVGLLDRECIEITCRALAADELLRRKID